MAVAAYNVFRGFAVGGYMALFPMYMRSLGYSMENIGGVIAVSSLVSALVLPAVGVYIDRMGPRTWVILTGVLQLAGIAILIPDPSLAGLTTSYLLFLLSFMAGQPSRMSFLARSIDVSSLGYIVGVTSSVFSASRLVGPAAGGYISEALGFQGAFEVLAASSLVGLMLFTILSAGVRLREVNRPRSVLEAYKSLLNPDPGFGRFLVFIGVDRLSWSLWFQMLTAHLYNHGFSEFQAGLAVTVSGVVQTGGLPLAGRLVDRLGAVIGLIASEALGAMAALLLMDPTPLRVYPAMVLMGVSIAYWVPSYNKMVALLRGEGGTGYTQVNTVRSIAGAPGPYLGGLLYDAISPMAPFAVSSILLLSLSILGRKLMIVERAEEETVVKVLAPEPVKSWDS
ncbi:putative MFS transporter [Aeropyrum pernix]|uniref:Putative MFS transporter n=1 Tax=Aeropyrum pernix TaxID=56636 RepID=A0A401HAX2_AERPX|nr:MFS transporter [Aeropyrum pernix]GBF09508.1 putative MFS transporter [Aeropyrum pernix]